MKRLQLPIGIQNLRAVRETGCYYVDKPPLVRRMVEEGATISSPGRAGSARACCSTRSVPCSRDARYCSRASISTEARTGPSDIPSNGSASPASMMARPRSRETSSGSWWKRSAGRALIPTPPRHRSEAPPQRSEPASPRQRPRGRRPCGRIRQADPRRPPQTEPRDR